MHRSTRKCARILREAHNWFVKSPNQYITPTIISENQHLNERRGELAHYRIIRDKLEQILITGTAKPSEHFEKAPDYVKRYLKD